MKALNLFGFLFCYLSTSRSSVFLVWIVFLLLWVLQWWYTELNQFFCFSSFLYNPRSFGGIGSFLPFCRVALSLMLISIFGRMFYRGVTHWCFCFPQSVNFSGSNDLRSSLFVFGSIFTRFYFGLLWWTSSLSWFWWQFPCWCWRFPLLLFFLFAPFF